MTDRGHRHDPARRWIGRRTAGRLMLATAALGVVASIVGTVVAWQVLGQLGRSVDQSLMLGQDAVVTVEATLDVADEALGALDQGLGSVVSTLEVVGDLVDETALVAAATATLAVDVGPSLERVDDALGALAVATGTVDAVLRQLSRVPFGPTYDPATSIDETVEALRADLAPIAESLRIAGRDLDGFADGSLELRRELADLILDVAAVRASLSGAGALIDQYRATAAEAAALSARTRADLDHDLSRSRLLIVVLGAPIAAGQFVPAWIGRELLGGAGGRVTVAD